MASCCFLLVPLVLSPCSKPTWTAPPLRSCRRGYTLFSVPCQIPWCSRKLVLLRVLGINWANYNGTALVIRKMELSGMLLLLFLSQDVLAKDGTQGSTQFTKLYAVSYLSTDQQQMTPFSQSLWTIRPLPKSWPFRVKNLGISCLTDTRSINQNVCTYIKATIHGLASTLLIPFRIINITDSNQGTSLTSPNTICWALGKGHSIEMSGRWKCPFPLSFFACFYYYWGRGGAGQIIKMMKDGVFGPRKENNGLKGPCWII